MKEDARVERAYRLCERETRVSARNFYYGIRLLPRDKRRSVAALYAFSRRADDAVDDLEGAEARIALSKVRGELAAAREPDHRESDDPLVVALGDTVERYRLPQEPFEGLLSGMERDLLRPRLTTVRALREYARQVAGTVGVLSLEIFGYSDPGARALAEEMGIALQYTNVIRDVAVDAGMGRRYVPSELLDAFGSDPDALFRGEWNPGVREALRTLGGLAEEAYRKSAALFSLVAPDARACPEVLYAIYHEVLRVMARRDYDVFRQRARLTLATKLRLAGGIVWRTRRRGVVASSSSGPASRV